MTTCAGTWAITSVTRPGDYRRLATVVAGVGSRNETVYSMETALKAPQSHPFVLGWLSRVHYPGSAFRIRLERLGYPVVTAPTGHSSLTVIENLYGSYPAS